MKLIGVRLLCLLRGLPIVIDQHKNTKAKDTYLDQAKHVVSSGKFTRLNTL